MELYKHLPSSSRAQSALLIAALLLAGGCSSPEEKAVQYYQNGSTFLEAGELEKARIEFQNSLQLVKTNTDSLFGLAQVAERQGDWERMFGLLTRVVDLDPKHRQAHINLGRLMLASGNLDAAMKSCDSALAIAADDPAALSLRAAILFKRGDTKGAVAQAKAVLSRVPDNEEALVVLASERMAARDVKGAIAYIDQGISANKTNVPLHLFKIQALETGGDTTAAEGIYTQLIASAGAKDRAGLRQALAQFHLRHKNQAAAEEQLRAMVTESPADLEAKLAVVRFIKVTRGDAAGVTELKAFIAREPENNSLRFALAELYKHLKDIESTQAVLNEIVEKADLKDSLRAKSMLAGVLLEKGEREKATELVSAVLDEEPKQSEALLLRAGMAIDEKRLDAAIADLRTVIGETPDSARAHLLLGLAHERAGSMELAEGEYLRAFQTSKQAETYAVAYADFLNRRGNSERAIRLLDDMLASSPNSLLLLQQLAKIRMTQKDWASAQQVTDRIAKLGKSTSVSEQIRGTVFAQARNYDASINAFKNAYASAPEDSRPMVSLVRAYVAAGKKQDAMSFVDSVLRTKPDNTIALQLKGQLLLLDKDVEGAIRVMEKAISSAPTNDEIYRNLAALFAREKRHAEAIAVLQRGLKALPDNSALQLSLAGVNESSGHTDEAIALYERVLERQPNSEVVINNLASLLSDRSDQVSLKRAYDLAKRLERSDVPALKDTWAWANYRIGNFPQAASALEQVTRQVPEVAVFRYHLGMVYKAQNNGLEARKQLEKAVELAAKSPFPQIDQARSALAEL